MKLVDRVRIGIAVPQSSLNGSIDVRVIRQAVRRAEAKGFSDLWTWDALVSRVPFLEPLDLLTYVAAITARPRLGVAVVVLPRYNPIRLARRLATLDQLSNGRTILGVGVGQAEGWSAGFGFPIDGLGARTEEAVHVMRSIWTQRLVRFRGSFWELDGVAIEPKPAQSHLPVWVGGSRPQALRRAVRIGNGWIGGGASTVDDFQQHARFVWNELETQNTDPDVFAISKRVYIHIGDANRDLSRLRRWFAGIYGDAGMADDVLVIGKSEHCAERLGEICDAGAQHLILNPVVDELEQIDALAEAVGLS